MKITIERKVLEQVLDWFEWFHSGPELTPVLSSTQVMNGLREALAQPAAQPTEPAQQVAQPVLVQSVNSAAKDAIMGAAYDFRDAHISGSMNLKRSAHAELENAVDAALAAAQTAPQPAAQQTEPAGEPVAFVQSLDKASPRCVTDLKYCTIAEHNNGDHLKYIPLYTRPAVPLSDERMCEAMRKAADDLLDHIYEFSTISEGVNPRLLAVGRSIEAAHKIGGAE
jgi:hypothetical protein